MRQLLLLAFVVGCAGKTSETPGATTDGGVVGDTLVTDTAKPPAETSVIDAGSACFGTGGSIPSTPFKLCSSDADCSIATHAVDCCGNTLYVGIAKSQSEAFGACEKAWSDALPACGCPAGPPKTEDGKTLDPSAKPSVKCTDFTSSGGICKTSSP